MSEEPEAITLPEIMDFNALCDMRPLRYFAKLYGLPRVVFPD